jgi:pullulanase/glycogen debranching enzyme
MVARFHDAGLEVILDVVYNHTAEGNELGPTLSFKGIDNASYYRLLPEPRYYINDTGTGNTLNLSNPAVIEMVTDSLRYWVNELHVDGFRFDLGTILARAQRLRQPERISQSLQSGPGAAYRQADRRAVGLRPGRLSGGWVSSRLGRVE